MSSPFLRVSSSMSSSSDSSPPKSGTSSRSTYAHVVSKSTTARNSSFHSQSVETSALLSKDPQAAKLTPESKPTAPKYTQRLIPKKYIPLDAIDENFNEDEWMKNLYGEDVRIVDSLDELPDGWILIEGNFPKIPLFAWN